MKNTITLCLLLLSLFSLPSSVHANDTSLDFINSRQYEGNYIATQTGVTALQFSLPSITSTAKLAASSLFSTVSPTTKS